MGILVVLQMIASSRGGYPLENWNRRFQYDVGFVFHHLLRPQLPVVYIDRLD
jgi:hypothetical protein